jgi:hypothetical protein
MDEEAVVDFLQDVMEKKLLGANASRTFYTQYEAFYWCMRPSAPEP